MLSSGRDQLVSLQGFLFRQHPHISIPFATVETGTKRHVAGAKTGLGSPLNARLLMGLLMVSGVRGISAAAAARTSKKQSAMIEYDSTAAHGWSWAAPFGLREDRQLSAYGLSSYSYERHPALWAGGQAEPTTSQVRQ